MVTKKEIRRLEKEFLFSPLKRLGQNFLIDANIKDRILSLASIGKDDVVIEIGSGLGQLTLDLGLELRAITHRYSPVHAVARCRSDAHNSKGPNMFLRIPWR